MPTYDYQCGTCQHRFEKYQGFHDEPLKTCPECGNEVRKVFSAAGIIFKGSGWYINDSRKVNGSKKEVKTESKTEAKSEATAESKSEAKTESKSEAKTESKSEAKTESSSAKKNEAAA